MIIPFKLKCSSSNFFTNSYQSNEMEWNKEKEEKDMNQDESKENKNWLELFASRET